jgi:hypothetical protein
MGFCFPGLDAKGGDLPPRRECAELWRKHSPAFPDHFRNSALAIPSNSAHCHGQALSPSLTLC